MMPGGANEFGVETLGGGPLILSLTAVSPACTYLSVSIKPAVLIETDFELRDESFGAALNEFKVETLEELKAARMRRSLKSLANLPRQGLEEVKTFFLVLPL